jgi:hypothetical protein
MEYLERFRRDTGFNDNANLVEQDLAGLLATRLATRFRSTTVKNVVSPAVTKLNMASTVRGKGALVPR